MVDIVGESVMTDETTSIAGLQAQRNALYDSLVEQLEKVQAALIAAPLTAQDHAQALLMVESIDEVDMACQQWKLRPELFRDALRAIAQES
jgi:hypothetical protein